MVLTGIDKKLLNDAQRLADDLRNHDQNPQIYLPSSVLTQIYLYEKEMQDSIFWRNKE